MSEGSLAKADHSSYRALIYKNNNLCTHPRWPALIYQQTSQHPFAFFS